MTTLLIERPHLIDREIIAFLIDRKSRHLSPRTIEYYDNELTAFQKWAQTQGVAQLEYITPEVIRLYLISLSDRRNESGIHASYRALKAWLNWASVEFDNPIYSNLFRKVAAPKIPKEPIPGVTNEQIEALLTACRHTPTGQRDRALLLTLYDTGVRKSEFCALDYGDLNLKTGSLLIRQGKGNKTRTVFLGNRTRRELIRYLRLRPEIQPSDPLFDNQRSTRLLPDGLKEVLNRLADRAGISPAPSPHDFRRAFCLQCLRNGMDLITLARLTGHTSLEVLKRYLALVDDDLQRSHADASPADNL
jgi:site-specific recombinase XerD